MPPRAASTKRRARLGSWPKWRCTSKARRVGCAPPLVAEGLALHVVHRVGVGAGVAEQAGEVELVASQRGAFVAEDTVASEAQLAVAGVAEAWLDEGVVCCQA